MRRYAFPWVPCCNMDIDGGAQRIAGRAMRWTPSCPGARGRELEVGSSMSGAGTGCVVELEGDGPALGRRARREGAKKRPGDGPGRVLEVVSG